MFSDLLPRLLNSSDSKPNQIKLVNTFQTSESNGQSDGWEGILALKEKMATQLLHP